MIWFLTIFMALLSENDELRGQVNINQYLAYFVYQLHNNFTNSSPCARHKNAVDATSAAATPFLRYGSSYYGGWS